MKKARVLGIQIQPELGNKNVNLDKISRFIDENAWYKPDLIVLPEVFVSGVDHNSLHKFAEKIPENFNPSSSVPRGKFGLLFPLHEEETTEFLSKIAKKYEANIIAGSFIEKCEKKDRYKESPKDSSDFTPVFQGEVEYKNTSLVFDRKGEILGKYQKIHMFNYYGSNESEYISPGDKAVVVKTDIGKIGLSICYDLRFPELYRALAYGGAEIITCVAAWPYPRLDHWVTLNKARAIENTAYIIAVNQAGRVNPKRQNLGMSMLINPWGDVIASSGGDEGVMMGEIDFGYLRKIREEFPVLNDRKLDAYRLADNF